MPDLLSELPLLQRLALSYAPARSRPAWLALFAFDTRLAGIIRAAREPLLAQMRLAWWRDRLAEPASERPGGDPVLDALGQFDALTPGLRQCVDGWEILLADDLGETTVSRYVTLRAAPYAHLAESRHCAAATQAARTWLLADLAANLSSAPERALVLSLAQGTGQAKCALPRAMRPLAVLGGLGRRSLKNGGGPLLDGRSSALVALRIGLFGR